MHALLIYMRSRERVEIHAALSYHHQSSEQLISHVTQMYEGKGGAGLTWCRRLRCPVSHNYS